MNVIEILYLVERDLQCDFNSPFWLEQDCSWTYNQGLMTSLGYGPQSKFQRELVTDATDHFYWRRPDALTGKPLHESIVLNLSYFLISDNHWMAAHHEGEYHFASPAMFENSDRLFYPHFGFAYQGKNTKVKVVFLEDNDVTKPVEVWDTLVDEPGVWRYFGKNLTEVQFLNDNWNASPAVTKWWRIVLYFRVEYHGYFYIDNIGNQLTLLVHQ